MVGGNGDRVLALGARLADVVGITGLGRTRADGQRHDLEWGEHQIDDKVDVVRRAAAGRAEQPELQALVQHVEITEDRDPVVDRIARLVDADPAAIADAPYLWAGSLRAIVEQVHAARERWGFTYFVTRSIDATAPVINALR
jgi:hypothetical protein